jgi:hypothetical protein
VARFRSGRNPGSAPPSLLELEDRTTPTFAGNQVFPLDNPWNQVVSGAPVAADSDAIIARIVARHSGTAPGLHPDFGNPVPDGALYGIPVNVVDGRTTPAVNVVISPDGWANESDVVPIPIPPNAVIEGDGATGPSDPSNPSARGDSHLLVYDKAANVLYELGSAARPDEASYPYGGAKPLGVWGAYVESVWDLNRNTFRTVGFTSADAAGLPIMPGLVRPDEALPPSAGGQGVITHAIRMTAAQTRDAFVYPASHEASSRTDADLPRMGERFRLKSSVVIPTTWPPEVRAVARAMKDYGLIVADNGSDMYFQGTPSDQWNMDAMLQLRAIKATDFEVVDLTPVVTGLDVSTGPTGGGSGVVVSGHNFSGAAGRLHVLFGGVEAASITILSDSQVFAVAPPHAAGAVDVQVQSGTATTDADGNPVFFGYGTSAVTPTDQFTFKPGDPVTPPAPPPVSPPGVPPVPPPGAPPSPNLVGFRQFAVGIGAGGPGDAGLFDASGTPMADLQAFPGFAGGVRAAAADFNGDGVADVVAGTGPGGPTAVRVLDGATHAELFSVAPFEAAFTGGVYVAAGDLTGDGVPDLVITPDEGGGPRVLVYDGKSFALVANFFGIDDPNFRGGARAAVGDFNGDHVGDLVVAAGFGGGPRIAVFNGTSLGAGRTPAKMFGDRFVFEQTLRNGVFVAAGDLDGDGFADLIVGGGPGGGPRVFALSGHDLLAGTETPLANFFGGNPDNRGGIGVAVKDLDGDNKADIVVGDGAGSGSAVTAYYGKSIGPTNAPAPAFGFDAAPGFTGGVFVG